MQGKKTSRLECKPKRQNKASSNRRGSSGRSEAQPIYERIHAVRYAVQPIPISLAKALVLE
jgi:hypothetical protein